jgi:hypothetical protein
MQTIENTRVYHGSSERLSDVQALLSYAVDGGERSEVVDAHSARREACYRAEEGAL